MKIFKKTPTIEFVDKRALYFAFSGVLLAASLALIVTRGLNFGIDFTGGSLVQITFEQPVELAELREMTTRAGYPDAIPQHFSGTDSFAIRVKSQGGADESADTAEKFLGALEKADPGRPFTVDQKEFVGPTVGRHLYKQALFAVVFSLLGIVGYVAFRFSNPLWGFAGVFALAHDVLATLGLFAALQLEVDLVLVAAVLTIAGYSINDSIVVFDRLREKMRVMRRESFDTVANTSINETLSRTLITSMTTLFTVVVLQLLGGTVIHDFAVTLTFGIVVGTYSSIAIAVPVVCQWEASRTRRVEKGRTAAAPEATPESARGARRRRR
ncbi:MAG: protein translocase subunit SecF [Elusimicrobiota bacterium]